MNLAELISRLDNWQLGTVDDVWAVLNIPTILYVNDASINLVDFGSIIGQEQVDGFIEYLKSINLDWVVIQAAGNGLPIGDPRINELLLSIGHEDATKLATEGRRQISILEMFNVSATKSEVEECLNAMKLKFEKEQIDDSWKDRLQAARERLTVWNGNPETKPNL